MQKTPSFNDLFAEDKLHHLGEYLLQLISTYGLRIVGSLVILLIAFLISKGVAKAILLAMQKLNIEITLSKFLARLAKIIIIGVGVLAALNNLGVDTTSFVALFTACSLAIGFAFKETLGNVAAGILVIVFRPFVIGDIVKLAAGEGKVKDISMFSITLLCSDNTCLIVPNSKVIGDVILNYSREEKRLVNIKRTIEPAKLCELKEQINKALEQNEYLLKDSKIEIIVAEVGASDITISINFWTLSKDYDLALASANLALSKIFLS